MKKILLIILILLTVVAAVYFALLYHAYMTMTDRGGMINPDAMSGGEYDLPDAHMTDGDFTYVDNGKLLDRIVGQWVSDDGRYEMQYDRNDTMTITQDGVDILITKADFVYLQPGSPAQTEFTLETTVIKDPAGKELGQVGACYHSQESGEDMIIVHIIPLTENAGEEVPEQIIPFRKIP